jgi:hypothetical protein
VLIIISITLLISVNGLVNKFQIATECMSDHKNMICVFDAQKFTCQVIWDHTKKC